LAFNAWDVLWPPRVRRGSRRRWSASGAATDDPCPATDDRCRHR
jgi:hypothetical protein